MIERGNGARDEGGTEGCKEEEERDKMMGGMITLLPLISRLKAAHKQQLVADPGSA